MTKNSAPAAGGLFDAIREVIAYAQNDRLSAQETARQVLARIPTAPAAGVLEAARFACDCINYIAAHHVKSQGLRQDLERHTANIIPALASPAATSGPAYAVNCCNCGRIIDTREESEGGDQWGHELSDDRWVCSPECLDAVADPDAPPAATSAETQGRDGRLEAVRKALEDHVINLDDLDTATAYARGKSRLALDMIALLDSAALASPAPAARGLEAVRGLLSRIQFILDVRRGDPTALGSDVWEDSEGEPRSQPFTDILSDEIGEALAALASPAATSAEPQGGDGVREAVKWRPIETVPVDGKKIDVTDHSGGFITAFANPEAKSYFQKHYSAWRPHLRAALAPSTSAATRGEPVGAEPELWSPKLEAIRLLAAEDKRQLQILELLETIREQIRLGVKPEHRPEGLMKNMQTAVYALRGRLALLNDAAIMAPLHAHPAPAVESAQVKEAVAADREAGGTIGPGHVCEHGIRWPWACDDCDRIRAPLDLATDATTD